MKFDTFPLSFNLLICFVFLFLFSTNCFGQYDLRKLSAKEETIQKDLETILSEAGFSKDKIRFKRRDGNANSAEITCKAEQFQIEIIAQEEEWSAVLYYSLQKMGFLFPHPRIQISPEEIAPKLCGQKIYWKPALKYRGFHFHTMHPNEWVHAFLMGKEEIAKESIRWMARNQQNIFDFNILRGNQEFIYEHLEAPFQLAKDFGIHAGISFGIALTQQNNWKLVSIPASLSDKASKKQIDNKLPYFLSKVDISYLAVELGTSEFTAVNYNRTINWLNQMSEYTEEKNVQLLAKVHISSNQHDSELGNFNFVPQYCKEEVGILPHTVFYYSLQDENAPMYGNENFQHMKDFMLQEKGKRMNWFYPESSYYISLDIDIPILHLEYLRARSEDTEFLYDNGIDGQLIFTTGHELGYWLIDWSIALYNNLDYNFDPMAGLKLLGEDLAIWEKHLKFHKEYFTDKQLVQIVTFSNGGDEVFPKHKIHNRNLLRELKKSKVKTNAEIAKLKEAIPNIPSTEGILNKELKNYMDITYLRFHHSLAVREALLNKKNVNLGKAKYFRTEAQLLMDENLEKYNRYPDAQVFEVHANPTSYQYGYGEKAANLHYWQREEEMVRRNRFGPLFMNVYDYIDIVF